MVQLGRLCRETGLDIAQTCPVGQLRKSQDTKLVVAGQGADALVAAITVDDSGEGGPGQKVHQLGKQSLADINSESSGKGFPEDHPQAMACSSRHHRYALKKTEVSYTYIDQKLS